MPADLTLEQYKEAIARATADGNLEAAEQLRSQAERAFAVELEPPMPRGETGGEVVGGVVLPAAGAALGAGMGLGAAGLAARAGAPAVVQTGIRAAGVAGGLYGGHRAAGSPPMEAAGMTILDLVGGRLLERPARAVAPALASGAAGLGRAGLRLTEQAGRGLGAVLERLYTSAGRVAPKGDLSDVGESIVARTMDDLAAGNKLREPTHAEVRAMAEGFEGRTGSQYVPGPTGEMVEAVAARLPATAHYIEALHSNRLRELDDMAERLFGKAADPEEAGDLAAEWFAKTGDELLRRESQIWEQVAEQVPDSPQVREQIAAGLRAAIQRADPSGRLDVVHPMLQSREAVQARRAIEDIASKLEQGEQLGTSAPVYLDQLRRDIEARARDIAERNPGSERASRLMRLSKELRSVQESLLPEDVAADWSRISRDYAEVKTSLDTLRRYLPEAKTGDVPDGARNLLRDVKKKRSVWRAAERLAVEAGDTQPLRDLSAAMIADIAENTANTRAFVRELNKLPKEVRRALPREVVEAATLYKAFRDVATGPMRLASTPGGGHGRLSFGALSFALANAAGEVGTALLRGAEREALAAASKRGALPTLTDEAREVLRAWSTDVLRYGGATAARHSLAGWLEPREAAASDVLPDMPRPTADTTEAAPSSVLDLMPTREMQRLPRARSAPPLPAGRDEYPKPTAATTEGPVSVLQLLRRQ